ncbi:sugar kinase [Collinsella sp. An271]|uniref:ROK family protein n=1 Tax=Collinsella sp. An271 TaxID=1965616 RepID=UPI000B3A1379|nr:ROK family protein [Collinsella sp. An271]OUO62188.1 sugar kinase [Collinsella sp. An271]
MNRYMGIDAGGTKVKWAVVDENYRIEEQGSIPTSFAGADDVIDAFCAIVEPYRACVRGIGLSMPGVYREGDPDGVVGGGGALHCLDGYPLGRIMRERTGLATTIENDAMCAALGEYAAGALKGVSLGLMVVIGTGLGGAIVSDGRILRGAHNLAGTVCFVSNDVRQPVTFGSVYGDVTSWRALRDQVCAAKGIESTDEIDGYKIFSWIEAGDEDARRGLDAYALVFDNMLMGLQSVIDPEVVVVGGGISARKELFEAFERMMDKAHVLPIIPRPCIRPAQSGNDANLFGAVRTLRHALGEEGKS